MLKCRAVVFRLAGKTAFALGKCEQATKAYRKAAELNVDGATHWLGLAEIANAQSDTDLAVEANTNLVRYEITHLCLVEACVNVSCLPRALVLISCHKCIGEHSTLPIYCRQGSTAPPLRLVSEQRIVVLGCWCCLLQLDVTRRQQLPPLQPCSSAP